MKVLVTGGAGYIGSHTIVELQQAGHEVVAIDNFENSRSSVLDQIRTITGKSLSFFEADIRKASDLKLIFETHPDIESVIHFAAYKAVGESVEKPLIYYKNNVAGTIQLVESMQDYQVGELLFSSSCTVYGELSQDQIPVTEETPVVKANSPYGNTKKICEEILLDESRIGRLKVLLLRYFNPIGAHDSALIGELPNGVPNSLVPFITQTAIGKRKQLTVFGNDYPTPDGTCVRDYIHVVDVAKAHVKGIEYIHNHPDSFQVFNIGTGKGNSVLEAIKAFESVSEQSLNYTIGQRRPGDVAAIYASCDKAEKELGWKAERDIYNSMLTAWKWEQYLRDSGISN